MNNDNRKFRVFDKRENKYMSGGFFLSEYGELFVFIDGVLKSADSGRYVIEWGIGLKDKNGKPIYDEDICSLYGRKCEIRWKDGGFGARDYPPCADTDGYIFSQTVPFTNRLYLMEDLKEIEVVGTIHDNPDDGWPVTPQGKPLQKGIKTWER